MKISKLLFLGVLLGVLCIGNSAIAQAPSVACGVAAYDNGTSTLAIVAPEAAVLDYVVDVINGPYAIENGVVTLTLPNGTVRTLDSTLSLAAGGTRSYPVTFPPVPANQQYPVASGDIGNNSAPAGSVQALSQCVAYAILSPTVQVQVTGSGQWPTLVVAPSIDIEKATNGYDADDPTGPGILVGDTVTWTYVVCNDGDVDLTDVYVDDDILGVIGTIGDLAQGDCVTLTATGPAGLGQYENLGCAYGMYDNVQVEDCDPSHYIGVDARISIEQSGTNEVNDDHDFTVTVEMNDGGGWVPAPDVDVTGTTDFGTIDSPNPDTTDGSGQMIITVSSSDAGTATVNASATIGSIVVATNGYGAYYVDNEKTWVDAYITIEPDGTNPINEDHTFTATVYQDDGLTAAQGGDGVTGPTPVGSGVPVTITLTNGGGAVANPAGPFNLNTDSSGQVSVTFTSATGGTVTGHASTTFSVGGVSLTRETDGIAPNSDDAVKTFIEQGDTFCTFTQGFYGNEGGKACDGKTTTEIINAVILPDNPVIVGILGQRSITFSTAADIILRLPCGGKPRALPEDLNVNANNTAALKTAKLLKGKDDRINNTLVGQVVALTLNMRLSTIPCLDADGFDQGLGSYEFPEADYICVQKGEDGCIMRYAIPESLQGLSVDALLATANLALAGDEELVDGAYDGASFVNELFDECMTIVTCPVDPVEICDDECDNDFDGTIDENVEEGDCVILE